MIFKDQERMREEFWRLTPKMRLIVVDADNYCMEHFHESPAWTEFLRTDEEQLAYFNAGQTPDKVGVHQLGRGADKRIFSDAAKTLDLIDYINKKYQYDPKRPEMKTVSIHNNAAPHLHFKSLT